MLNVYKELKELKKLDKITEVVTFATVVVGVIVIAAAGDDVNGYSLSQIIVRVLSSLFMMTFTVWYRLKAVKYIKYKMRELRLYLDPNDTAA